MIIVAVLIDNAVEELYNGHFPLARCILMSVSHSITSDVLHQFPHAAIVNAFVPRCQKRQERIRTMHFDDPRTAKCKAAPCIVLHVHVDQKKSCTVLCIRVVLTLLYLIYLLAGLLTYLLSYFLIFATRACSKFFVFCFCHDAFVSLRVCVIALFALSLFALSLFCCAFLLRVVLPKEFVQCT